MSLNQSLISDFSEYYRWSQRTKIKYKLHYGWCTGRRFTAWYDAVLKIILRADFQKFVNGHFAVKYEIVYFCLWLKHNRFSFFFVKNVKHIIRFDRWS